MINHRSLIILTTILIAISTTLAAIFSLSILIPKSNSWAFTMTQIDRLHRLGFDGSGVTIGIVDTGVDIHHQEFDPSSFIAWKDFVNNRSKYYDDDGHGTHIAGILVSKTSIQGLLSGINMQGIAPGAKIVVAKATSKNQYPFNQINDSLIAASIQFCIDKGADIICLSLGKNLKNLKLDENSKTAGLIQKAINNGIFVIAPAGDDGQDDDGNVVFPGTLDNVITVGATCKTGSIAVFSSRGHQYLNTQNPNKKPELIAPGTKIMSTRNNGAYGEMSGTSQAAAYVTGIIALLLQAYPEYKHDGSKNRNQTTIKMFKETFAKTAKKIGPLEKYNDLYRHDDLYGYGLIQAFTAYEELAKNLE